MELPLYLALLWVLVAHSGIVGAAIAWTIRVSADCVALIWLSRRFMEPGHAAVRSLLLTYSRGHGHSTRGFPC